MNLTIREVRELVRIARENPEMAADDIISSISKGYTAPSKIQEAISSIGAMITEKPIPLRPSHWNILVVVAAVHDLTTSDLMAKSRKQEIVRARQQYCLFGVLFNYSLDSIGQMVNKDHATVLFHRDKALAFYREEGDYFHEMEAIITRFPDHRHILRDRLETLINEKK